MGLPLDDDKTAVAAVALQEAATADENTCGCEEPCECEESGDETTTPAQEDISEDDPTPSVVS